MAPSRIRLYQWGKVNASRPGIKNHPKFDDEADEVEYVDYRYWVRLCPNPGFDLPVIGYWSRANGRRRPKRPWE